MSDKVGWNRLLSVDHFKNVFLVSGRSLIFLVNNNDSFHLTLSGGNL